MAYKMKDFLIQYFSQKRFDDMSPGVRAQYDDFVKSGAYTKSGVANRLVPTYYEVAGKIWGIVGLGNIGKQVAKIAKASSVTPNVAIIFRYKGLPFNPFTTHVDIII